MTQNFPLLTYLLTYLLTANEVEAGVHGGGLWRDFKKTNRL